MEKTVAHETSDHSNLIDQEKVQQPPVQMVEHRQHAQSPSQKTVLPRWHKKGKERSTIALICSWMVDHQISISFYSISLLFFIHAFIPDARRHTQKFFRISYYNPATGTFALGWDDVFFIFYWLVVFTGLRCSVMDYILTPLASTLGLKKRKPKVRFSEQAWILIYYSMSWATGIYVMYNSNYWLDLRALWKDWPSREMDGLAKWYYLVQFGFWLQQIVVVNIEERRKDHWQMFTHHIITCCLIFTSYGYHQYRVGTLFICLMDTVDILLPLAKILKYLKYETACDIAFGAFILIWFLTRHVIFMAVLYSIYHHIPQEIQYGCYRGSVETLQGPFPIPNDWSHLIQPFRDPVGLVCWNNNIKWAFLGGLGGLQCVLLGWFYMVIRVAYKVVTGQGAEDSRSDDEGDDEEEATESHNKSAIDHVHANMEPLPFVEKEVLSTDPGFTLSHTNVRSLPNSRSKSKSSSPTLGRTSSVSSSSSARRKHESAHASGVNLLAGSSDRKELLGRIGCDKGSTSD
ncbi:hypothetical protein PV10_05900 [Exophiala mesophila]|uniref:TLC domain-containing protein n=1 Tax=Exophiala mesophila TaxID=212818 RepID=A0A0D1ZBK9_EXOME|nr:uncharacterized protein PV10_05900 [Exophiala mesophila]KIV91354.1 hypothetical protein PV10_05900 [Exophiala mesophila]